MKENGKRRVLITDEGIIFIDALTADLEAFDKVVRFDVIDLQFATRKGYLNLMRRYTQFISKRINVAKIHSVLKYLEHIYWAKNKKGVEPLSDSLMAIHLSSRIMGISEDEMYKMYINQITDKKHD